MAYYKHKKHHRKKYYFDDWTKLPDSIGGKPVEKWLQLSSYRKDELGYKSDDDSVKKPYIPIFKKRSIGLLNEIKRLLVG